MTCQPEHPDVLPDDLAAVARDRLTYNRALAAIGRYSLATVSPAVVGLHRLVQAVIQARLGEAGERAWAEAAVNLLRAAFPNESWEVSLVARVRTAAAAPARRRRACRAAGNRR